MARRAGDPGRAVPPHWWHSSSMSVRSVRRPGDRRRARVSLTETPAAARDGDRAMGHGHGASGGDRARRARVRVTSLSLPGDCTYCTVLYNNIVTD